jgi:hypothetical protein
MSSAQTFTASGQPVVCTTAPPLRRRRRGRRRAWELGAADAFADGLTAAHIVHFAGVGTQPTIAGDSTAMTCARQLRDDFLADPTATLDDSCVATAHGPAFELA